MSKDYSVNLAYDEYKLQKFIALERRVLELEDTGNKVLYFYEGFFYFLDFINSLGLSDYENIEYLDYHGFEYSLILLKCSNEWTNLKVYCYIISDKEKMPF